MQIFGQIWALSKKNMFYNSENIRKKNTANDPNKRQGPPMDLDPNFGLNKRARVAVKQQLPRFYQQHQQVASTWCPSTMTQSSMPANQPVYHQFIFDSPYFCNQSTQINSSPLIPPLLTMAGPVFPAPSPPATRPVLRPRSISDSVRQSSIRPLLVSNRRKTMKMLTGTVEKVLMWSKMTRNQSVLYEVFGFIDYVRQGPCHCEKFFMLQDAVGPVLQVTFYEIDRPLDDLPPGSLVKVQGRLIGRSRLQAFRVQVSNAEELAAAQHVIFICDRASHDLIAG